MAKFQEINRAKRAAYAKVLPGGIQAGKMTFSGRSMLSWDKSDMDRGSSQVGQEYKVENGNSTYVSGRDIIL